jgi:hypothetical protein
MHVESMIFVLELIKLIMVQRLGVLRSCPLDTFVLYGVRPFEILLSLRSLFPDLVEG